MNNFREARKRRGYTQEDLAQKLGVSRTAYVRYENGERECSFRTLRKLAEILNVSTDYLLENSVAPSKPLSNDETQLLTDYRRLPLEGKRTLLSLVRQLSPVTMAPV